MKTKTLTALTGSFSLIFYSRVFSPNTSAPFITAAFKTMCGKVLCQESRCVYVCVSPRSEGPQMQDLTSETERLWEAESEGPSRYQTARLPTPSWKNNRGLWFRCGRRAPRVKVTLDFCRRPRPLFTSKEAFIVTQWSSG